MISIIAAIDKNRGIGIHNTIPWDIPEDLQHFKKITMGHPVIMGRKTYESIGRLLPGRTNIVITRNPHYAGDVKVVHSLDEALSYAQSIDQNEVFIIGGEEIFKQSMGKADKLYLTILEGEYAADTFFPDFSSFTLKKKSEPHTYPPHIYTFNEFVKRV
ncbi:MAG: dihydrofolate reductase [Candidatus Roizmanbacteria bacterium]|nr:dihydrofolate reductase [Candidatus Roizmanbacteria bacterium]